MTETLRADLTGRIGFEVYCSIGDVRSAMHELHRAAELATLHTEWLAKQMAQPGGVKSIGGSFLDDAILIANKAVALLHQTKAHHANMVADANRLADLDRKAGETSRHSPDAPRAETVPER